MSRPRQSRAVAPLLAATVLVAILAVLATAVFGRSVTPSPAPSAPPPTVPSTPPSAPPSPEPSLQPSVPPGVPPADGNFAVDLENATDHDLRVVIDDVTGTLRDASTGKPGDGMSVRWFDSKVENVDDPETLRVVWVGLPVDDVVRLTISESNGKYRFDFVQAAPPANSDATGYDRVLVLEFGAAIASDDVTVTFREVR